MATALKWKTSFPAWDKRAIFSSTAVNTGVPFLWAKIDAGQQASAGQERGARFIRAMSRTSCAARMARQRTSTGNRRDTILGNGRQLQSAVLDDTSFGLPAVAGGVLL